jgi:hypothetical protein
MWLHTRNFSISGQQGRDGKFGDVNELNRKTAIVKRHRVASVKERIQQRASDTANAGRVLRLEFFPKRAKKTKCDGRPGHDEDTRIRR